MSGTKIEKGDLIRRLEYHRSFREHGFFNELAARSFSSFMERMDTIRKNTPQLAPDLKHLEIRAQKAKLATDLQALEELLNELSLLQVNLK